MSRLHSDATRRGRPRPIGRIIIAALVLASTLAAPAAAQPIDEPKTYAGDLWSRPRLTGDWGGFRDQMATKGIRFPIGLNREDAIEMYYNAALTPWLSATADLQIINPALTKTLGSDGRLQNVDMAVVAGLRIYARF